MVEPLNRKKRPPHPTLSPVRRGERRRGTLAHPQSSKFQVQSSKSERPLNRKKIPPHPTLSPLRRGNRRRLTSPFVGLKHLRDRSAHHGRKRMRKILVVCLRHSRVM